MSLKSLIKRDKMEVFRRLYLKRRQTNGEYESDWQEVPRRLIKKWGNVKFSVDDVKPNFYKFSGVNFQVLNNDGFFSEVTQEQSFWFGYLSRFRTLVKIEAGYTDTDGSELPTESTLYIGLITNDFKQKQDNIIQFQTKHLSSVFEEFPADKIPGLGATQTASDVVTKIRDYIDSNSISVFQKFISLGAWTIQTTTTNYNMATTTNLQGQSCWGLMKKLAEAENYVVFVDKIGEFYFQAKSDVPSVASYHFSGIGDGDKSHGHNIMRKISIDEGLRKVYNRIRVKFNNSDTITSYYIKEETWDWGDSSSSFRFGVREFNYNNDWLVTATAETIGGTIFNEYSEPKTEIKFDAKFVPQLMVQDRVDVTYQSAIVTGSSLWGFDNWDEAIWGGQTGFNISLVNQNVKILNIKHDLDKFVSSLEVREI